MSTGFHIHYVSISGRPSIGHRTRKGKYSFQFPRRVVPKNVLTIGQLHSSPMLVRSCLKSCMLGFSIMWTKNLQMSKLGLKGRGMRDQIADICWIIQKAREFQKNNYLCFINCTKVFDCVQFSSVTQSCLTLWDPMNHSTPGLPVHHQLLEFTHSCLLSWWCHLTISSSIVPCSSCLKSFPPSGSFQMS